MARAVEDSWPGELSGPVVTRYGYSVPCRHIEIIESAHPVPDAASVTAAQRILDKVKNLGAEDQVLCLISGGGSSLLALQVARHGQSFKAPCILLSGGEPTVTARGNGRGGRKTEFLLSSKPGIGIAKPTGMKIIGNCALLKNRKHHQFENLSSLHTFSAGLI